jgi:hypothetical protein
MSLVISFALIWTCVLPAGLLTARKAVFLSPDDVTDTASIHRSIGILKPLMVDAAAIAGNRTFGCVVPRPAAMLQARCN